MIRRVAFKKAFVAGVLGAAAWEIVVRVLILAGIPMFDLVRVLGSLMFGDGAAFWLWWPGGMLVHAAVGAIWAIFYAYFFWSFMDYPPPVQGVLFSLLPALLAGLIMVPQMDLMRESAGGTVAPMAGLFAWRLGWTGPVGILLGHLTYGLVMGRFYQRPVGYPTGKLSVKYG